MIPKFRAWDTKCNEMHYEVEIASYSDGSTGVTATGVSERTCYHDTEDYKLMQSTGLKDSKNVEIYEGDIIRHGEEGPPEFEWGIDPVFYNENVGGFTVGDELMWDWLFGTHQREIIGNVHQHPELLVGEIKSTP